VYSGLTKMLVGRAVHILSPSLSVPQALRRHLIWLSTQRCSSLILLLFTCSSSLHGRPCGHSHLVHRWSCLLTTNLESPATCSLPLLGTLFRFRPCATQHLQKVSSTPTHTAVNVGFARFDVVVEVVAESLDVRDDFLAACGCEVAGEQNCGPSC
jgi:hypothetical protein